MQAQSTEFTPLIILKTKTRWNYVQKTMNIVLALNEYKNIRVQYRGSNYRTQLPSKNTTKDEDWIKSITFSVIFLDNQ